MIDKRTLKKISEIVHPRMWLFIGSIALIIAASIFEVFGISVAIPIINGVVAGGDFLGNLKVPVLADIIRLTPFQSNTGAFTFLILLVLFSVGCSNALIFGSRFCANAFATDITCILRTKIFARYLGFGRAFYDRTQFGSLVWIAVGATANLGDMLLELRELVINLIMAIAFTVFLLFISWQLTIFVVPLALVVYYPLTGLIKKIYQSSADQVSASVDLASYTTDVLSNVDTIRSYANEAGECSRFDKKSHALRFHALNAANKNSLVPVLSDMIASAGFLALVFFSCLYYMARGPFPVGTFLVFFFVLRRVVMYMKPVNALKAIMARMAPLLEKIGAVFDDKGKTIIKDGAIKMGGLREKIEFKGVSFSYITEKEALKDISFTVKKGQAVAIVGSTGAGKTTIAHLLCRFYDRDSGAIEIDGVDIKNFSLNSLRKNIALVSQDVALFNDTIGNNITYGTEAHVTPEELDDAARRASIYDFIMGLPDKYDTLVGDKGVKLSGGEKQRVSIARAILKKVDILILDEATSSLDSETEGLIQKALNELIRAKTVIAIAHRLSTIKDADRIIVLEDGRIAEQGSLDELLEKRGRFYHYWELQKFY